MKLSKRIITIITPFIFCFAMSAQDPVTVDDTDINDIVENPEIDNQESVIIDPEEVTVEEYVPMYESVTDSLLQTVVEVDTLVNFQPLPRQFFLPAVYNTYIVDQDTIVFKPDYSGVEALKWLEDADALNKRQQSMMQRVAVTNPSAIKLNVFMLPEAPKKYDVVIDPENYTVEIKEHIDVPPVETTQVIEEVIKKHWNHIFVGNLQFSQAYVSPNWYQGGNNNLNMLLDLNYAIKLNQAFHPNLLFDTNIQYKLGLYSTPEDSLRSYNISQDLLQVNSTFGIKAIKKWYYTVNAQFKTQLFNSYPVNSNSLRSAFLTPGELNVGLGMTYNTKNAANTFAFDASISPLSYNLMICRDSRINAKSYGIDEGKHTKSQFGSSLECKLMWKMTDNITLNSRLFTFTDYNRAYADLENTIVFAINRYLTTQVFVHLRYDTNTPYVDPGWHKLQVKEILSLGFTYKFSRWDEKKK